MKVIAISDTHGQHESLVLPLGDILIHAGDCTNRGTRSESLEFMNWFESQPHKHKIFIAGNHDWYFESKEFRYSEVPAGVHYLNDSMVSIEGFNIWGSPIQPEFFDWAFNRKRGAEIKQHWDLIPMETDILVTHGPVSGIHDTTVHGDKCGCVDLKNAVQHIEPQLFICGHIHEAYGTLVEGNTTFVNASVLDHKYKMINPPIEIELTKNSL